MTQSFFDELKRHPVPVEEAAVRQIANNSFALDVYCWLAWQPERDERQPQCRRHRRPTPARQPAPAWCLFGPPCIYILTWNPGVGEAIPKPWAEAPNCVSP